MNKGKQLDAQVSIATGFRMFPARFFIGSAPDNDVTSSTTYTTHTRVSDTNIYIYYIYIHVH